MKCDLATCDYSAQNKPDTNPTHQLGTSAISKNNHKTGNYNFNNAQPNTTKNAQPDTPPESGINIIFLKHAFEKFWLMYPVKQSKTQTWEAFKKLSPTHELFDVILNGLKKQCEAYNHAMANGHWVPNWKNANNWLTQYCWDESLFEIQTTGNQHARTQRNYSKQSQSSDLLWDSCKHAFKFEQDNSENATIIDISEYKQRSN